jgi:hypothetical protein
MQGNMLENVVVVRIVIQLATSKHFCGLRSLVSRLIEPAGVKNANT